MKTKFKNNSSIGNRVVELRKKQGLARPALAEKLGVSLSALQNWEINQTEPQATKIIELADLLETTTNYLLHGIEEEECEKPVLAAPTFVDDDFVWVDDFRDVRVSAGFGAFNEEQYPDQTKVERAWLIARGLNAANCAMFTVNGESMYPTLKDGEEIIVDRSKKELHEGKIYVLNHQGSMWVKKVQIDFNGIELISDNKSYRPIKLTAEEANELIVIGQVVRGYRDF